MHHVDDLVKIAYDLAFSIIANVTDLCGAASLVEDDKPFRGPIHNISLNAQLIINTLSEYVNE